MLAIAFPVPKEGERLDISVEETEMVSAFI
jgi:hypothetical protein